MYLQKWHWAELLESFDYIIDHCIDIRMKYVDAISLNAVMAITEDDVV